MENILNIFTALHNSKKHNIKRIILAALLFLIFTSFVSLNAQWAKTYKGGEFAGFVTGRYGAKSIQQTSDGGYIVAGYIDYRGGEPYWWILKLSAAGDIEWQHMYDNTETPESIRQTDDGGYIVAGSCVSHFAPTSSIRVVKLNSSGNIEWEYLYGRRVEGSSYSFANSIQQTNDGGYIVAGSTSSFGAGFSDFWILKLFPNGDIEWQRTYGGSQGDPAYSIQQTNDGGYIVAGYTFTFDNGGPDFWVLKLSSNGNIEWQKTYGGAEADYARSIQQTSDGGYVVVGETKSFGAGELDIWILKLSSTGEAEWQKTYGSNGYEVGSSIQQTSDGGYIAAGNTFFVDEWGVAEPNDFWVLKLSSAGDIEWQLSFRGDSYNGAESIQQTFDGGYVVAGWTRDIDRTYDGDLLVLKLSSEGDMHPFCEDYIYSPDITVFDTYIIPGNTNILPQDTDVTPEVGYFIPQEIDATVTLLCGAEEESDEDGEDSKPPCFIATAAYGSPLHPHLDILRDFRDQCLMLNKVGRTLVKLYYKYSPSIADIIAKHKALKVIVRNHLVPMVIFSYLMVHFGLAITAVMLAFISVLPILIISFFKRKLKAIGS